MKYLTSFLYLVTLLTLSQQAAIEIPFTIIGKKSNDDFLVDLPLQNQDIENSTMLLRLGIGTPAQYFNVIFDSGSDVLWVMSKDCSKCRNDINKFNKKLSSSYKNLHDDDTIEYGDGDYVYGTMSEETITVDGFQKTFKLRFMLGMESEQLSNFDGIIGFGYKVKGRHSLLDMMYSNGVISKALFTQHFHDDGNGILAIGDFPKDLTKQLKNNKKHPIHHCELIDHTHHWQCHIEMLYMDGQAKGLELHNRIFIMDTGSSENFVTPALFKKIVKAFFNDKQMRKNCKKENIQKNMDTLVCSYIDFKALAPLVLKFKQGEMILYPDEYFYLDEGKYYLRFYESTDEDVTNIIGQPFLRKYYSIFDKSEKKFKWVINPTFNS